MKVRVLAEQLSYSGKDGHHRDYFRGDEFEMEDEHAKIASEGLDPLADRSKLPEPLPRRASVEIVRMVSTPMPKPTFAPAGPEKKGE
jgi:hypothetical protein